MIFYLHFQIEWQRKAIANETKLEFDTWQVYCANVNGDEVLTKILPKNSTEYLFTNLRKYLFSSIIH